MRIALVILFFTATLSAEIFDPVTSVGTSARRLGLANIRGLDKSAHAIFENPAVLTEQRKKVSIASFYTSTLDNSYTFNNYAFSYKKDNWALGLGFMQNTISGLEKNDFNNGRIRTNYTFNTENSLTTLAIARQFSKTNIGLGINRYVKDLHDDKTTYTNINLGIKNQFKKTRVLINAENAISSRKVTYTSGATEKAPSIWSLGAEHPLTKEIELAIEGAYMPTVSTWLPSLAVKAQPELFRRLFYISGGWNQHYLPNKSSKNRFMIGLGLELFDLLNMHLAFTKADFIEQDNQFYFSLNMSI